VFDALTCAAWHRRRPLRRQITFHLTTVQQRSEEQKAAAQNWDNGGCYQLLRATFGHGIISLLQRLLFGCVLIRPRTGITLSCMAGVLERVRKLKSWWGDRKWTSKKQDEHCWSNSMASNALWNVHIIRAFTSGCLLVLQMAPRRRQMRWEEDDTFHICSLQPPNDPRQMSITCWGSSVRARRRASERQK